MQWQTEASTTQNLKERIVGVCNSNADFFRLNLLEK